MENTGNSVRVPSIEDIVGINRRHIERTGGRWTGADNLKEQGSLEWVLEAIQYPLFGVDLCPTLTEKAAQLAWTIIGGHVFWDGNKRTGMTALLLFLRLNGCRLNVTSCEIVQTALQIATAATSQDYGIADLVQWIRDRLIIEPTDQSLTHHSH